VKVGDTCNVTEYKGNGIALSLESTSEEVTWTKATVVRGLELLTSFGHKPSTDQLGSVSHKDKSETETRSNKDLAIIFSFLLVVFTAPAWVAAGVNDPSVSLAIGLFALWMPLGFFNDD
jgi:hypothetical protein